MKRIACYGDSRILNGCFHCGAVPTTVDHAPPKVLLDRPFPTELVVVPSCYQCNNSASLDEAYLACVVECTVTGETEPARVGRSAIAKMLRHSPALAASMAAIRTVTEGQTIFRPDMDRIRRAVVKIARAHAAYELHELFEDEPQDVLIAPIPLMDDDRRDRFEASAWGRMYPEVGSRAVQRLVECDWGERFGWIDIQKGRYRYMAAIGEGRIVRMVLSEYLACEVVWDFA